MEGNRKECVWSKPQSIKYILLYIGNKVVYKAQKPVLEGGLVRINPIIGTCSNKKGKALRFSGPFLKRKYKGLLADANFIGLGEVFRDGV